MRTTATSPAPPRSLVSSAVTCTGRSKPMASTPTKTKKRFCKKDPDHEMEPSSHLHSKRSSHRCGDHEPQTPGARRLHQKTRTGSVHLLEPRSARDAEVR